MANTTDDVGEIVESKECVNLLYLASTQGEICDPKILIEQAEAKGVPVNADIHLDGHKSGISTSSPSHSQSGYSHDLPPQSRCDTDSDTSTSTTHMKYNVDESQSNTTTTQADTSSMRCVETDILMNRKERSICEQENSTERVCPRVNCPEKIVRIDYRQFQIVR